MDDKAAEKRLTIEDILKRVRAEVALLQPTSPAASAAHEPGTRASLVSVPMLTHPDDGEGISVGRPAYAIDEFTALDEEDFLQNAYRVLLGRNVDGAGRTHYLSALRDGRSTMIGVLGSLRWSAEGRARGVRVRRLLPAFVFDRLARLPVLGWFIAPLVQFATLSRTVRRLDRRQAATDRRHRELISAANATLVAVRKSLVRLEATLLGTAQDVTETRALAQAAVDGGEGARLELAAARLVLADQTRLLAGFVDQARSAVPAAPEILEVANCVDEHALDSLYVAFENRFRGSTDDIAKRLLRYLPIFRHSGAVAAGGEVLDIGCGRGEWLSLLKNSNVRGRGVDLNASMVAEARARGLEVLEGDAVDHLRGLPGDHLAAVTGFHIVEHLPFALLVRLFDEAYRALQPGGFVLFETPNPENLVVGACTFNYDPTHIRALPPDLLRFLAEARGYEASRIVRTDADCELDQPESGFTPVEVNDWFRQPPDYALYARKPLAGST